MSAPPLMAVATNSPNPYSAIATAITTTTTLTPFPTTSSTLISSSTTESSSSDKNSKASSESAAGADPKEETMIGMHPPSLQPYRNKLSSAFRAAAYYQQTAAASAENRPRRKGEGGKGRGSTRRRWVARFCLLLSLLVKKAWKIVLAISIFLFVTFYLLRSTSTWGARDGESLAPWSGLAGHENAGQQQQAAQHEPELFITCSPILCGGLGNMLWRVVSLYGIAKKLGRRPYFIPGYGDCYKEFVGEAEQIFPGVAKQLLIIPTPNETEINFATNCCRYEDPLANRALVEAKEKYVRITADYLQHYLFFADYETEIREMLSFSPALIEKNERVKKELFKEDPDTHKLCVHTRRGDFVRLHLESEAEFTQLAVSRTKFFLKGRWEEVSVLMMGDDREFMLSLNFSDASLRRVHLLPASANEGEALLTRGEEFAFAATHCDSLLITAPASTYAWWIAYLMTDRRREGLILYNADERRTPGDSYHRGNFPRSWMPLRLVAQNGVKTIETRDGDW